MPPTFMPRMLSQIDFKFVYFISLLSNIYTYPVYLNNKQFILKRILLQKCSETIRSIKDTILPTLLTEIMRNEVFIQFYTLAIPMFTAPTPSWKKIAQYSIVSISMLRSNCSLVLCVCFRHG